jgi:nucleotide-binding universal stress UspA family protein
VPLIAVHMHTRWDVLVDPVLDLVTDWDATAANEHKILGPRLADSAKKYPDVPVQCIIARDRPAYRLLEQAQHAQLVIVGSRGRGAFSGLLLGSVSHALLHHAPCPVAVVRPEPDTGPGDLGGDLSRLHPTEFQGHLRGAGLSYRYGGVREIR